MCKPKQRKSGSSKKSVTGNRGIAFEVVIPSDQVTRYAQMTYMRNTMELPREMTQIEFGAAKIYVSAGKDLDEVIHVQSMNGYECATTRRVACVLASLTANSMVSIEDFQAGKKESKADSAYVKLYSVAYGRTSPLTAEEQQQLYRLAD